MKFKIIIIVLIIIFFLTTISLFSKRNTPQPVQPLEYNDLIIKVNHDKIGFIEVYDKNNNFLWEKRIYKIKYNFFIEKDVQDIFIKKILINDDKLIVINEKDYYYSLDLKTKKVKKLSKEEIKGINL